MNIFISRQLLRLRSRIGVENLRRLSTIRLSNSSVPRPRINSVPLPLCHGSVRFITLTPPLGLEGTSAEFKTAVEQSSQIKEADNQTKLKLYGLFKQATKGKNTTKKPGSMDLVGKAKWEAWTAIGDISKEDAERKYVSLVAVLCGDGCDGAGPATTEEMDGLVITTENGVRTIRLNRPNKKNALTRDMYKQLTRLLRGADEDDSVKIVVLTGTGDYFCSGNDLSSFMTSTDPAQSAQEGRTILLDYVGAYIDLTKPLIALVNGPAVGIAVTILGLCDTVFCTDKSTFVSPFSQLGQSPEGCSSYTFPRIMGYAKASELLYFNQKFTAKEAEVCGLVTQVIPEDKFQAETTKRVLHMSQLPIKSLVYSKELVRGRERALLHEVNAAECERLEERWQSDDCINAIMSFFSKQKAKV